MSTEEGSHTVADGQKLYTKTWKVRAENGATLSLSCTNLRCRREVMLRHDWCSSMASQM
jgi:hypothetical protein